MMRPNGGEDGGSAVRTQDIIVITGRKDLCEKAKGSSPGKHGRSKLLVKLFFK